MWARIVGFVNTMHEKGIISLNTLMKSIGNGCDTRFWTNIWVGETPIMSRFDRLFALEMCKECFVHQRWGAMGDWR